VVKIGRGVPHKANAGLKLKFERDPILKFAFVQKYWHGVLANVAHTLRLGSSGNNRVRSKVLCNGLTRVMREAE
jgi:hypothetical protein